MASIVFQASQLVDRIGQNPKTKKEISTQTRKVYKKHTINFFRWCQKTYGSEKVSKRKKHIPDYVEYLKNQKKSASTIHTYVAAICRAFHVPMDQIQEKPTRRTSENTRSRGVKKSDSRKDTKREASPRLYDLAEVVGVRRNEYKRLRRDDIVTDESGYICVRIKQGKGGKYQEQRILPEDEEFVKNYFDGTQGFVFSKNEMNNKIDLHHLRELQAQRAYIYYTRQLEQNPKYHEQLKAEVKARWLKHNSHPWDPRCVEGQYTIRGGNRSFAKEHGLPVSYDRLAVMAVSVFHLAHWRCDVTVDNYLLAI
ncbi:hypothetical protein ABXS73_04490 [Intestinimonas butyriciproducens]|uniref:hypothetical protein n=1 Tax=Intestinimonas butyriciproducens TaxID=1297617 RepID=UPI0034E4A421